MSTIDYLIHSIIELLKHTKDEELLDLILKILIAET